MFATTLGAASSLSGAATVHRSPQRHSNSSAPHNRASRVAPRAVAVNKPAVAATALADKVNKFSSSAVVTTALLVALPALADEAVSSSGGEISPFAGVVDITVLGVVGLLAVQGNKKAEAAKAAGGKKKGKK